MKIMQKMARRSCYSSRIGIIWTNTAFICYLIKNFNFYFKSKRYIFCCLKAKSAKSIIYLNDMESSFDSASVLGNRFLNIFWSTFKVSFIFVSYIASSCTLSVKSLSPPTYISTFRTSTAIPSPHSCLLSPRNRSFPLKIH